MKDARNKTLLAGGVLAVALLAAAFAAWKSLGAEGDTQANVTEFAKSIDATKSDTPSVPADRLALGRTGK